ncbi:DUF72 domain-containing protein [Pseudoxanthomonas sp. 10H]|uniref:DUF72 domain-containing protein n=1 Tax=Pseudoxanthomonas sp. 10H TaxID=3242729 RepID=UPI003558CC10
MAIHIGISGWRYRPWRGVFYPPGLPQHRELEYAAHSFSSIELNGSFYSLQRPQSWRHWASAFPPGSVLAVKGPRYITHMLRLRDVDTALANFFASGVLQLRERLGPLLWQLPPTLRYSPDVLEPFLSRLPRDTDAALALARRRERVRMRGRASLPSQPRRPIRHALEVRHDSFRDPGLVGLLRHHGVALVVADTGGRFPHMEDVTADFMYLRLHGPAELYASGYPDDALDHWATRIRCWADGHEPADARSLPGVAPPPRIRRDVYCYFDNDAKVDAPFDAKRLYRMLASRAPATAGDG